MMAHERFQGGLPPGDIKVVDDGTEQQHQSSSTAAAVSDAAAAPPAVAAAHSGSGSGLLQSPATNTGHQPDDNKGAKETATSPSNAKPSAFSSTTEQGGLPTSGVQATAIQPPSEAVAEAQLMLEQVTSGSGDARLARSNDGERCGIVTLAPCSKKDEGPPSNPTEAGTVPIAAPVHTDRLDKSGGTAASVTAGAEKGARMTTQTLPTSPDSTTIYGGSARGEGSKTAPNSAEARVGPRGTVAVEGNGLAPAFAEGLTANGGQSRRIVRKTSLSVGNDVVGRLEDDRRGDGRPGGEEEGPSRRKKRGIEEAG